MLSHNQMVPIHQGGHGAGQLERLRQGDQNLSQSREEEFGNAIVRVCKAHASCRGFAYACIVSSLVMAVRSCISATPLRCSYELMACIIGWRCMCRCCMFRHAILAHTLPHDKFLLDIGVEFQASTYVSARGFHCRCWADVGDALSWHHAEPNIGARAAWTGHQLRC